MFNSILVSKTFPIFVLIVLWFISGCAHTSETSSMAKSENVVPLVRILSTPEKYDGKRITTIGVAVIRFKEEMLFLNEGDAQNGVTLNGVLLDFSESKVDRDWAQKFDGQYIAVWGEFEVNTMEIGLGIHAGKITKIEELLSVDDWGRPAGQWDRK